MYQTCTCHAAPQEGLLKTCPVHQPKEAIDEMAIINKLNGFFARKDLGGVNELELKKSFGEALEKMKEDNEIDKYKGIHAEKPKQITVQEAMKIVCEAIRTDESYREGWLANIAMAFKDNYRWYREKKGLDTIFSSIDCHIVANKAAEDFLNILIQ